MNYPTMYSSSVPWNILSANVGVSILTDGWNLADAAEFDPEDVRTFTIEVAFDSPFTAAPVVHLGLTGFDIDQRDASRITLKTAAITESGFQAVISTWSSTRVYAVDFSWVAIGG
jgi:hypothetical protein